MSADKKGVEAQPVLTYFVKNGLWNGEDGTYAVTAFGKRQKDGWYYLLPGMDDGEGPYLTKMDAFQSGCDEYYGGEPADRGEPADKEGDCNTFLDVALGVSKDQYDHLVAVAESATTDKDPYLPINCDGLEQEAFEEWAKKSGYDMTTHPIHWLFLDKQTYAARQGWSAAIRYCNAMMNNKKEKEVA